jgi:hypothetical protein
MKENYIMATNAYLADIKDFEKKSEYIKMFPKMYLDDINLISYNKKIEELIQKVICRI